MASALPLLSCGPTQPRNELPEAENTTFPQSIVDGRGNTLPGSGQGLSAIPSADFQVLAGGYGGSLYYMYDQQSYSFELTTKAHNGVVYPYLAFQSEGQLGNIAFGAYLQAAPYPYTLASGVTHYMFASNILPAELVANWVGSEVSFGLILGVRTQPNGAKQFDPTQSAIYIMDCAFSVGVNSCSSQYDTQMAGFLNDFGKR
ncbi:MAG: hypothetical protein IT285_04615 [Bdellovibrionales bacterium]|nr:hypothetical protein [Bdellovibrionales bacterium]